MRRIAVTGGSGQIAYSLLFRIASGELFGPKEPVALHLLEVPGAVPSLRGVVMELEDCAFPLLQEVRVGSDAEELFAGVHLALLLGAKPRGPGMERKDLLQENGKIFAEQGRAIDRVADRSVVVFVVGNPCNTNCLIAMHHAPSLPPSRFHAMTRLDQHRAQALLARRAKVAVEGVEHVVIWGNHSATQVPDFFHATIRGKKVPEVIQDQGWLQGEFMETVQQRGGAVIAARGKSSAASAAHAILRGVHSLFYPGPFFSSAICSDGNPYGVQEGLVFSFPCKMTTPGQVAIVEGLELPPFLRDKLALTERELLEERDAIRHLLG